MLRALVVLLNVVVALTWAATASSTVAVSVLQAAPLCEDAEAGCEEDDELGLDEDEPFDDELVDEEEPFDDEETFDEEGFEDFSDLDDDSDGVYTMRDATR